MIKISRQHRCWTCAMAGTCKYNICKLNSFDTCERVATITTGVLACDMFKRKN